MSPIIIENYVKKSETKKIPPYAKLILCFPRLKMYFNYLIVGEGQKSPRQHVLILLTLRIK
jgi:hypothetical protein